MSICNIQHQNPKIENYLEVTNGKKQQVICKCVKAMDIQNDSSAAN